MRKVYVTYKVFGVEQEAKKYILTKKEYFEKFVK